MVACDHVGERREVTDGKRGRALAGGDGTLVVLAHAFRAAGPAPGLHGGVAGAPAPRTGACAHGPDARSEGVEHLPRSGTVALGGHDRPLPAPAGALPSPRRSPIA